MSSYSFLYKYIIIGDTSNYVLDERCRKILYFTPVSREEVQIWSWYHNRGWIRVKNYPGKLEANQVTDLGYGTSDIDIGWAINF